MKKHGIKVGYTPGVLTNDVADMNVFLTLATIRRVKEQVQTIVQDTWKNANASPFWMVGTCLAGKTVGIMGLGRIGLATAKRFQVRNSINFQQKIFKLLKNVCHFKAFEAGKVIYTATKEKEEGKAIGAEFVSFEKLLTDSDIIVITAAFNESTKGSFDKCAFAQMKSSAFLINTSRGGLVNQDDLIDALKTGQIR